ncbi:MAG: hypothetical protein IJ209_04300 [Bacteroidaceae bacterium]|nr:hypothetical protein [Bacteroidaceae bacterium]
MKKIVFICCMALATLSANAQSIWVEGSDRYTVPKGYDISGVDSIVFRNTQMLFYTPDATLRYTYSREKIMTADADSSLAITFEEPADKRVIWKPTTSDNQYNNDYTNPESKWSFKRSKESEHFIVYWDKAFGDNPNASTVPSNLRVDIDDLLQKAEKFYDTNVNKLRMAIEGESQVDNYKMIIHVLYQSEWLATGSGYDDKIGALWVNPSTCKPVGHTIGHEIGHSFQYQVACDHRYNLVGAYTQRGWRYGFGANGSGGNSFWEQCAQWQGFQDYPSQVFGYDVTVWLYNYHRHFNHEWMRYASYWWQYHLVEKHGYEAFGRLWRESKYPEDPFETYTRLFCDGNWETFWDDYFEYATKLQNYQFTDIHKYITSNYSARNYKTQMYKTDDDFWQVAYANCPETSGVNFIQVNGFKQGEEVSVSFEGLNPGDALHASDPGKAFKGDPMSSENVNNFTKVSTYNNAGKAANRAWRIGFVAVVQDGTTGGNTIVSDLVKVNDNGTLTWTVPEKTIRLSLCVVATPKVYNRHEWNEKDIDDVQWPYRVKFDGCKPVGL